MNEMDKKEYVIVDGIHITDIMLYCGLILLLISFFLPTQPSNILLIISLVLMSPYIFAIIVLIFIGIAYVTPKIWHKFVRDD